MVIMAVAKGDAVMAGPDRGEIADSVNVDKIRPVFQQLLSHVRKTRELDRHFMSLCI